MEDADCQGDVGTVSARARIGNTLVAMAEFQCKLYVSLIKNPACNRFQCPVNLNILDRLD